VDHEGDRAHQGREYPLTTIARVADFSETLVSAILVTYGVGLLARQLLWRVQDLIRRISFRRYKAFHRYSLSLQPQTNVLVGPNNAGKSTAISIARLTSLVLRTASRYNPSISIQDGDRNVVGYPLALSRINDFPGYSDANVHHEFRDEEARVEAVFGSGARLYMVWPKPSDEIDPYFYFDYRAGMNAKRRQQVAQYAPSIGVIPGLNPVEDQENLLSEKYVTEATGSRLTSRHFETHCTFYKTVTWTNTKQL
jgi:predicted ATP-dependent endonuclease of OLD family